MESENKKMPQNPGAQQGNINNDRDSGQEALGSNQDLQAVENQGTKEYPRRNDEGEEAAKDDLQIDAGGTATAAFDEGGEPRSKESLRNRGGSQGSNDAQDR